MLLLAVVEKSGNLIVNQKANKKGGADIDPAFGLSEEWVIF